MRAEVARRQDGKFAVWRWSLSAERAMPWECIGVHARFHAALEQSKAERERERLTDERRQHLD